MSPAPELSRRLSELRAEGSEASIEEATRLEREAEEARGSSDPGADEVRSAADVGFSSDASEDLADEYGLEPGGIRATGRSGATVADVEAAKAEQEGGE